MSELPRIASDLSTCSDMSNMTEDDSNSETGLSSFEMDSEDGNTSNSSGMSSESSRRKRTVLVTGAAGFIGSATAYSLLERGDDVVIIDGKMAFF